LIAAKRENAYTTDHVTLHTKRYHNIPHATNQMNKTPTLKTKAREKFDATTVMYIYVATFVVLHARNPQVTQHESGTTSFARSASSSAKIHQRRTEKLKWSTNPPRNHQSPNQVSHSFRGALVAERGRKSKRRMSTLLVRPVQPKESYQSIPERT
jgi:hypothetical protein